MGTKLPTYWKKIKEPEAGVYELVMLANFEIDGNPENRRVLYVVKSLEGCLNEAFEYKDVGTHWTWLSERWCSACRAVGMIHCAHPDECGNMRYKEKLDD